MKKVNLLILIVAVMIGLAVTPYLYAEEKPHTGDVTAEATDVQSQFFCGYCHVLTYPKVIKKAYNSWKAGKHNNVICEECHHYSLAVEITAHKRIPRSKEEVTEKKLDLEHMKKDVEALSRLMTILEMDQSVIKTKPRIDDRSCTKCHPQTGKGKEGEYWTKKINFTEYAKEDGSKGVIPFVHKSHFDKEKWIEGHEMHCTTCHQHQSEQRHFEVSKEECFLCHFKNLALNEKRGKCSLCHEIPTKSLQKKEPEPGAKLITHQTIEKDKVPCNSCHYDVVRGDGVVKEKECLSCHDIEALKALEGDNPKKIMHEKHIAGQNTRCFDCHEPITHKKGDFIDVARRQCQTCHPDHHFSQKTLLAGEERKGVQKTPSLMEDVRTGCLGCHQEERTVKGEKVLHGDPKTCARCHVEKTAEMAKEWKDSIGKALKEAKGLEKEAEEAIERAKGKAPEKNLKEAMAKFKEAKENVQIVEAGGGVHNQKYSIQILDIAMNNFEDAADLLKE